MYSIFLTIHLVAFFVMFFCAGSSIGRYRWYKAELTTMTSSLYDDLRPRFRAGMRNNFWLAVFCIVMGVFNALFAYRSLILL